MAVGMINGTSALGHGFNRWMQQIDKIIATLQSFIRESA